MFLSVIFPESGDEQNRGFYAFFTDFSEKGCFHGYGIGRLNPADK
jgi:hypothetical protein